MGRSLCIAVDSVRHGLAAADVVRNVFDTGHRARAVRDVHRPDIKANPMPGLELVGGRENLDLIFDDFTRLNWGNRITRQLMKGLPWLGPLLVKLPI